MMQHHAPSAALPFPPLPPFALSPLPPPATLSASALAQKSDNSTTISDLTASVPPSHAPSHAPSHTSPHHPHHQTHAHHQTHQPHHPHHAQHAHYRSYSDLAAANAASVGSGSTSAGGGSTSAGSAGGGGGGGGSGVLPAGDPLYHPSVLPDMYTSANADWYGGSLGEHPGYIRILPRTNAASTLYKKRCETCSTTHDGSFGAGRFCSSRCARTVGGLAHRKKRMLERDAKQRMLASRRVVVPPHPGAHGVSHPMAPHPSVAHHAHNGAPVAQSMALSAAQPVGVPQAVVVSEALAAKQALASSQAAVPVPQSGSACKKRKFSAYEGPHDLTAVQAACGAGSSSGAGVGAGVGSSPGSPEVAQGGPQAQAQAQEAVAASSSETTRDTSAERCSTAESPRTVMTITSLLNPVEGAVESARES